MKKLTRLAFLLSVLVCLFFVGVVLIRKYPIIGSHSIDSLENLLIKKDRLPPGWKIEYTLPVTDDLLDWGKENTMRGFSPGEGLGFGHEYVYHFNNSIDAIYGYYSMSQSLPILKENQSDFLSYHSKFADSWYMVCDRNSNGGHMCDVLGRYDDLVMYFSISANSEWLTSQQLRSMLETIDDRLGSYLAN